MIKKGKTKNERKKGAIKMKISPLFSGSKKKCESENLFVYGFGEPFCFLNFIFTLSESTLNLIRGR